MCSSTNHSDHADSLATTTATSAFARQHHRGQRQIIEKKTAVVMEKKYEASKPIVNAQASRDHRPPPNGQEHVAGAGRGQLREYWAQDSTTRPPVASGGTSDSGDT